MLALHISMSQPAAQPSNLASQPHLLTVEIRKPPARSAWGPQQIINSVQSAVQGPLPTHVQALVQGHGSQLPKDRGHVDRGTAQFWLHALHH